MVVMKVDVPDLEVVDEVELDKRSTALIIVDMQNDFVKEGGSLRVPTAESTVPSIKKLLENARSSGVLTIFTQDTHYEDDPEYRIWGVHAKYGTWGWEIVDELRPDEDREVVIRKTRYDGFYGTPMDDLLRIYGVKNVVVVGTVANICVLHTAGSAALRWYKVYVPMDGISAINEFDYYLALRQIQFLYKGVIVRSVEGVRFV